MTDLEKVIKGLECCIVNDIDGHELCSQCPYDATCVSGLMMDALEWLKKLAKCNHDCKIDCLLESYNKVVAERDELMEKQPHAEPRRVGGTWYCGTCGDGVVGYDKNYDFGLRYNYCPMCGTKVMWDGETE